MLKLFFCWAFLLEQWYGILEKLEGILEETWVILEVPPVSADLKLHFRLNTLNLTCDQNLLEQLDRILEEVQEILADR